MVFFTCSVCGESVKKVSVEKHLLTSRRCNQGSLSCMDCGKDFDSVSYKSHNACITEAAKYGGLNYKAPANANKGQQKQSEWTENVRAAISMLRENRTGSNALLRLLETISSYENVPRKKPKFMNFLRNSFSGVQETVIVAAWDAIEAAVPKKPVVSTSPKPASGASAVESPEQPNTGDALVAENGSVPPEGEKRSKKHKSPLPSAADTDAAPVDALAETPSTDREAKHHHKKKKARLESDPDYQNGCATATSPAANAVTAAPEIACADATPAAAAALSDHQTASAEATGDSVQSARRKHRHRHRQETCAAPAASPLAESAPQPENVAHESEGAVGVGDSAAMAGSTQKKKKHHRNHQQKADCANAGALVEAF